MLVAGFQSKSATKSSQTFQTPVTQHEFVIARSHQPDVAAQRFLIENAPLIAQANAAAPEPISWPPNPMARTTS